MNNKEKSKIDIEIKENDHCLRCMEKGVIYSTIWNRSGACGISLQLCEDCWKDLFKEINKVGGNEDVGNN